MESSFTYGLFGLPAEAIAALSGAFVAIGIFSAILAILEIVAMWRIFKKAGRHGWASIIPIYNLVVLFNVAGMSGWWTLAVFGFGFVNTLAQNIINQGDQVSGSVLLIISWICSIILYCYLYSRIAKGFKKGFWFTIGLIFLNPLFMMILGLGGSKYSKKALEADF